MGARDVGSPEKKGGRASLCLDWLSFGLLGGFCDCLFGQRHVMQSGTVSFMYPVTVESIMCTSESVFNYKPHCSENGLVVCDGRRVEMEAPVCFCLNPNMY